MTDYTIGDDRARRSAWVRYVERTYLVDHATAQRVVFARWLAETGGLTDWAAAAAPDRLQSTPRTPMPSATCRPADGAATRQALRPEDSAVVRRRTFYPAPPPSLVPLKTPGAARFRRHRPTSGMAQG